MNAPASQGGGRTLKGWLVLTCVLAGVVVVLLALLWVAQRKLIYLPDTSPVPPASDAIPHAENVILTTDDGLKLGAWYVPADGDQDSQRGTDNDGSDTTDGDRHDTTDDAEHHPTVLVANGNGGNRAGRAPLARALSAAGFDVLLFDYRGYGGNAGSPSEDGLAADARAAYRYLARERDVPADRMIYFGESLGTGVVTGLADEYPPAGLLLRSPFTDLASVGQRHYPVVPVDLLLRDRYPVADRLATLDVPTTIVYGTEDAVVPPDESRAVAASARGSVEVVAIQGAGHNDAAMFDGPELIGAVTDLVTRSIAP